MKIASEQDYYEEKCPGCGDTLKIPKRPATHTIYEQDNDRTVNKLDELEKLVKEKLLSPPKEPEKKEKEILVPNYMPSYVCKGEGCEGHDNPNYRRRVEKRCTNCNMWGGPKNAKKCAMCGSTDFEDVDEEELDTLGIPKPGHSHEDI